MGSQASEIGCPVYGSQMAHFLHQHPEADDDHDDVDLSSVKLRRRIAVSTFTLGQPSAD